jgi:hypothetical protein
MSRGLKSSPIASGMQTGVPLFNIMTNKHARIADIVGALKRSSPHASGRRVGGVNAYRLRPPLPPSPPPRRVAECDPAYDTLSGRRIRRTRDVISRPSASFAVRRAADEREACILASRVPSDESSCVSFFRGPTTTTATATVSATSPPPLTRVIRPEPVSSFLAPLRRPAPRDIFIWHQQRRASWNGLMCGHLARSSICVRVQLWHVAAHRTTNV